MENERHASTVSFERTNDGERALKIATSRGLILFLAANTERLSDEAHFLSIDHGAADEQGGFAAIQSVTMDEAAGVLNLDLSPALNGGSLCVIFNSRSDLDAVANFLKASL